MLPSQYRVSEELTLAFPHLLAPSLTSNYIEIIREMWKHSNVKLLWLGTSPVPKKKIEFKVGLKGWGVGLKDSNSKARVLKIEVYEAWTSCTSVRQPQTLKPIVFSLPIITSLRSKLFLCVTNTLDLQLGPPHVEI